LGSLGVCSTFLIFLMITSWFVGHTQLYQLARSELDSFDLFDSVDFIYINSCGRSAWIINELYNLTCIGLSLVDKIHSCLIIIIIIDVMGSDVLWLPERIFVDRMIFDLTSYNDSSRVITLSFFTGDDTISPCLKKNTKQYQTAIHFHVSICFNGLVFLGKSPETNHSCYPIWLWLTASSPWKDPPFLIGTNHLFRLGPSIPWLALLVITRG
jgi:hypothetical protein